MVQFLQKNTKTQTYAHQREKVMANTDMIKTVMFKIFIGVDNSPKILS